MSTDVADSDQFASQSTKPNAKTKKRKSADQSEERSRKKQRLAAPLSPETLDSSISNSPTKTTKRKHVDVFPSKKRDVTSPLSPPQAPVSTEPPSFDSDVQQRYQTPRPRQKNTEKAHDDGYASELASPFQTVRLSIYVPLYAIALASAAQSLLSTHLAPLLLTYYAPARGVVLAFSDPCISTKPPNTQNHNLPPPSEERQTSRAQEALVGDENGVSWVWLTATILVFRPERDMAMEGHINICSEGFIGISLLNYFQCGIARTRIPSTWRWNAPDSDRPLRKRITGRKGKIKDFENQVHSPDIADTMDLDDLEASDTRDASGDGPSYFTDAHGETIPSKIKFRVVDTEVGPTHGTEKWSLHIEGTLLSPEDEEDVLAEERAMFERMQNPGHSRRSGSDPNGTALMSGGLDLHRDGSIASGSQSNPSAVRHRMAY